MDTEWMWRHLRREPEFLHRMLLSVRHTNRSGLELSVRVFNRTKRSSVSNGGNAILQTSRCQHGACEKSVSVYSWWVLFATYVFLPLEHFQFFSDAFSLSVPLRLFPVCLVVITTTVRGPDTVRPPVVASECVHVFCACCHGNRKE